MTAFAGVYLWGTVATIYRPVSFFVLAVTSYAYRTVAAICFVGGGVLAMLGFVLWALDSATRTARGPAERDRRRAVVFLLSALIVLAGSLVLPWWEQRNVSPLQEPTGPANYTVIYITGYFATLPGNHYDWGCTVEPANDSIWGPICNITVDAGGSIPNLYSVGIVPYTNVGRVYANAQTLLLSGVFSASAAALLRAAGPEIPSDRARHRVALALAILALAVGGPIYVALAQPGAIAADAHLATTPPAWSVSFWGSCVGPNDGACTEANSSASWGAGPGWYLSLAGGSFLAIYISLGLIGAWRSGGQSPTTSRRS